MMRTVLVVDDEDDIREVAQLALELESGWNVITANSGTAALERARVERPDVILLDVMMPELDGPRTLELLRGDERTRDIPVVFLTAKVRDTERARLESFGVAGVLAKPFDPLELAGQISRLLGW